jgi:hypothetical protein
MKNEKLLSRVCSHCFLGWEMSAILDRVQIETAPVVEIDTEAPAAYIRISQNPIRFGPQR